MSPLSTYLSNLKEFLLVLTALYFYGLAFAVSFGKPLYGVDHPVIFLTMCTLFLLAIGYEIFFNWWKNKIFIFWFVLWVVSYGVIGLYLAPVIFGRWILSYVLFEPLIIVFVGGFAFSYGRILARHFTAQATLTAAQVEQALQLMPGWKAERGIFIKTFEFADFSQALNFVNQVGRLAIGMRHYPDIRLAGQRVAVSVQSRKAGGLTRTDFDQARKIDAV